jgi:hypothetical protein
MSAMWRAKGALAGLLTAHPVGSGYFGPAIRCAMRSGCSLRAFRDARRRAGVWTGHTTDR